MQRYCRQRSNEDGDRDIHTLHEQTGHTELRPGDDVRDRIDSLNHDGYRREDREIVKSWLFRRSSEQDIATIPKTTSHNGSTLER